MVPAFILVILTFGLSSCVKDEFDSPPADGDDPDITANASIAELKDLFTGTPVRIPVDVVIKGVVISNDKEGNFYKTLVIQDSTAGISIRVDQPELYADFPVGRRVFVKCKNLWLGDYAGLIQLGGSLDESDPENPGVGMIPSTLVNSYILKGRYNIAVEPLTLTIDIFDNIYQNMLVSINNVEFAFTELGFTYADAVDQFSENRTLVDCNRNQTILRTSGFAAFAGDTIAGGNGTITAILSVFNSDFQLIINSPEDIQFNDSRCTGSGGGILGIRNLYLGNDITLPADQAISGIVISDKDNGNFDSRNMIIQDSTGGIVIRFMSTHNFFIGDAVEIDISGLTLSDFNGLVQIIDVPNINASKTGTGAVTPRNTTIAQVQNNSFEWESTLVQLSDVLISGGSGQYSGTTTLTDNSGTISMFTRTSASFASSSYPTDTVTVTGIVGNFNGSQINIRNTGDIE